MASDARGREDRTFIAELLGPKAPAQREVLGYTIAMTGIAASRRMRE